MSVADDADDGVKDVKKKKKKMGKKERMKLKAKQLVEERGMSEADARKEAGLNPIPIPTKEEKKKKNAVASGGNNNNNNINGPSPALLTANIKNAKSLREMFELTRKHWKRFNHIHLSAFWNLLGRITTSASSFSSDWQSEHEDGLALLVERTRDVIASDSSGIRGRELANIAHGVAKCGVGARDENGLVKALAEAIGRHLAECNGQEIANIAWAFAKSGYFDPGMFANLAEMAEKQMDRFNSQEITNVFWAFATAECDNAKLFKALAKAIDGQLHGFNSQGLSNTAWALAKIGYVDATLFRTIAQTAQKNMDRFNAQDFSNLCWAFAKAGQYDAELFATLAKNAERHMGNLNAQGLSNSVWSFAKAGHLNAELFTTFGKNIERKMFANNGTDFNAQDIANIAWAYGKACHLDDALFTVLARMAEKCLHDYNTQDIVNLTWSFSKLGRFDMKLLEAVKVSLLKSRLDDLDAPNIANLAWTYDKAGKLDDNLVSSLARAAVKRVNEFTATDITNVAWTFANAGKVDDELFSSMAKAVERIMDDFGEEDLDNLEWAFQKANQTAVVKQLKQQRRMSSATNDVYDANVDVSECGRIIVAGGGIGGAALAVSLQKKGFDVVVLESDASFDSRAQGYGLTVQATDAMQAMGVDISGDDAPSTSHYTFSQQGEIIGFFGEAFGVKSKDRQEVQNSGRFIHIPRQVLRQRILEAVRPDTIRWNSKLKSYDDSDKDKVTVTLIDDTKIEGALLIGSDGIFSTVRRQLELPGDRLNYVGLCVVLGIVNDEILKIPLAKRRIFETVDGTTRIYAMPFTKNSTMWQLSFPCSEDTAKKYTRDASTLKAEISRRCGNWHDPIPEMLTKTPLNCMSGYPVYDRELLETDVLRPKASISRRVTIIGDAAHPMTPFKAQGANQAISDAVLFADTLIEGVGKHGSVNGFNYALPLFEKKMLSRSSRAVLGSREKAKEMHSNLALQPARKAQREAEFDLRTVLRSLKEKQITASRATDKEGLDALVLAVCGGGRAPSMANGNGEGSTHTNIVDFQGTKVRFNDDDEEQKNKIDRTKKRKKAEKKEKKEKKKKSKKQGNNLTN